MLEIVVGVFAILFIAVFIYKKRTGRTLMESVRAVFAILDVIKWAGGCVITIVTICGITMASFGENLKVDKNIIGKGANSIVNLVVGNKTEKYDSENDKNNSGQKEKSIENLDREKNITKDSTDIKGIIANPDSQKGLLIWDDLLYLSNELKKEANTIHDEFVKDIVNPINRKQIKDYLMAKKLNDKYIKRFSELSDRIIKIDFKNRIMYDENGKEKDVDPNYSNVLNRISAGVGCLENASKEYSKLLQQMALDDKDTRIFEKFKYNGNQLVKDANNNFGVGTIKADFK